MRRITGTLLLTPPLPAELKSDSLSGEIPLPASHTSVRIGRLFAGPDSRGIEPRGVSQSQPYRLRRNSLPVFRRTGAIVRASHECLECHELASACRSGA